MARRLANGEPPEIDVKTYFLRRLRRIYPPHALIIFISWLVAAHVNLPTGFGSYLSVPTRVQFWAHVFMLHTFVPGAMFSINCVLWTIAIESHFYVIYPLLLVLRRRFGMMTICAALFMVMLCLRALDKVLPPAMRGVLTYNFPGLLWQWVLGAVVAEQLTRHPPQRRHGRVSVALALCSALAVCAVARFPHGILLVAVLGPLGYAIVILAVSSAGLAEGGGVLGILEWVGFRSYSLYLTHPVTLTLVAGWAAPRIHGRGAILALAVIATYGLAAGYFQLVERRFLSPSHGASRIGGGLPGPPRALAPVEGRDTIAGP